MDRGLQIELYKGMLLRVLGRDWSSCVVGISGFGTVGVAIEILIAGNIKWIS